MKKELNTEQWVLLGSALRSQAYEHEQNIERYLGLASKHIKNEKDKNMFMEWVQQEYEKLKKIEELRSMTRRGVWVDV